MPDNERRMLHLHLIRFLGVFYAEILRMLNMAGCGDATSMLQTGKMEIKKGAKPPSLRPPHSELLGMSDNDEHSAMQMPVGGFGVALQKLLGHLEKLDEASASVRAGFLLSVLSDYQRPGPQVSAVVIEKMDRLQALLLSFEGSGGEVQEEDREWCIAQWEQLRDRLMDKQRELEPVEERPDGHASGQAASSTDIVCLEDSQTGEQDERMSQVAILSDGTTRPLTNNETAEIAYHEELERQAAEREARGDEQRWLEFRASRLRDEEEALMQQALEESGLESSSKRARVRVQVEGTGGRVVRSETFDMIVNEGEALTYKIMVLPKNDPEVCP